MPARPASRRRTEIEGSSDSLCEMSEAPFLFEMLNVAHLEASTQPAVPPPQIITSYDFVSSLNVWAPSFSATLSSSTNVPAWFKSEMPGYQLGGRISRTTAKAAAADRPKGTRRRAQGAKAVSERGSRLLSDVSVNMARRWRKQEKWRRVFSRGSKPARRVRVGLRHEWALLVVWYSDRKTDANDA